MSAYVSLDAGDEPTYRFVVPRDGSIAEAVAATAYEGRTVSVVYRRAADLRTFLDAWVEKGKDVDEIGHVFPLGERAFGAHMTRAEIEVVLHARGE